MTVAACSTGPGSFGTIDPIAGGLDVDSTAGNVTVASSDPKDYASVAGNLTMRQ